MKNLLCSAILVGLLFSSCKKDDEDNAPSGVLPYTLSAPKCLLAKATSNLDGDISISVYQYDEQRRLSAVTSPGTVNKVTYTYFGDMRIDNETYDDGNGGVVTTVTTHYLNSWGFISQTIHDDSTQTLYTYDNQGYLIRTIEKSQFGDYSYGTSYQYSKGNRITSYSLNLDFSTGEVTDSALSATYYYYENMQGKIEEVGAWVNRLGRGSLNELRSVEGGFSNSAYKYTMGSNGMPSSVKLTFPLGEMNVDMEWKCN